MANPERASWELFGSLPLLWAAIHIMCRIYLCRSPAITLGSTLMMTVQTKPRGHLPQLLMNQGNSKKTKNNRPRPILLFLEQIREQI